MRAVAVVSVVLYHARLFGVHGGYVGVDVFFVISGFLITTQLLETVGRRGISAMPTFYTRRIRRLLPASATVVIATVVAFRLWGPPLSVRPAAIDGIFTAFYGLNYRLAVEGTQYLNQGAAPSPLLHYWSLAVEEQFYLCWPILIAGVAYFGRRFRNVLLTVVLISAAAISFHYSITLTRSDEPWAYFSLVTRVWELALGALVAVAATRLARLPRRFTSVGWWIGALAVVIPIFVYNDGTAYPGSAVAWPVVGSALVIACGCGPYRPADRVLGVAPMQYVGRVSYSWYLWHWPMLIVTPMIVGHALNWPERTVVVVCSLLVATGSFLAIERPVRSRELPNWQWFVGGAILSGSVVIVCVLVLANLPTTVGRGAPVTIRQASGGVEQLTESIQRALVAGTGTRDAPSNLSPEPAKAHSDVPVSSTDECHADLLVIAQGPCVFGDPTGEYTVVLFGDSHMQQWQPAFDAAGAKAGWRVVNWTKSACPAQEITVYDAMLKRTYTECNTWRAITLRRIAALHPNMVVVTSSEDSATNLSASAFAAATVATLRTLEETTKAKIVYLEDTPYPGSGNSIPGCVASHLSDVSACNFAVAHAYTSPERHLAIRSAIQNLGGVTIVDPQPWICTPTACPAVVGNLLVYRDDSHLSVEYSTWLAPVITDMLTAAEHPR